jgi:hypothetical protein
MLSVATELLLMLLMLAVQQLERQAACRCAWRCWSCWATAATAAAVAPAAMQQQQQVLLPTPLHQQGQLAHPRLTQQQQQQQQLTHRVPMVLLGLPLAVGRWGSTAAP